MQATAKHLYLFCHIIPNATEFKPKASMRTGFICVRVKAAQRIRVDVTQ